jgi:hypothetical protein
MLLDLPPTGVPLCVPVACPTLPWHLRGRGKLPGLAPLTWWACKSLRQVHPFLGQRPDKSEARIANMASLSDNEAEFNGLATNGVRRPRLPPRPDGPAGTVEFDPYFLCRRG